jgi:uncharacterized protein (DUF1684 family)
VGQVLLDEGDNEVPDVGLVRLEGDVARVGDLVLRPEEIVLHGTRTLQLVRRAGRMALRRRDPAVAARRRIRSLPAFPIAPEWCRPARLVGPARTVQVVYPIGTVAPAESPGMLEFAGGQLEALRMSGRILIVFADETTGKETYGGGRFLWLDEPIAQVDFNLAENPPCVFSEHLLCPRPGPQNRLAFRVEAGETYPVE